jgi:cell fate (sporulation/competence/biofilm development) regulator YlbF (YheA/YmcA/DUF963 family)
MDLPRRAACSTMDSECCWQGGWIALEIDMARAADVRRARPWCRLAERGGGTRPLRTRALPARAKEREIVIWDKAQELGRMIGQSDEYRALRRAEQSLRGDEDTQKKLDRISTLARQVDTAIAQGQMPDEATTLEYETAVRELETSGIGQQYVVSRANFEKYMQKVNEQISAGMEQGAASSIITLS